MSGATERTRRHDAPSASRALSTTQSSALVPFLPMRSKASAFIGTALLLIGVATFSIFVSQPAASPRGEVPVAFASIIDLQHPVFLRGELGIIAPETSTFVWCETGKPGGAAIQINRGQTQIYAFEGYEYALLSIGARDFPGPRTVIAGDTWVENGVTSLLPQTLYHVYSTVELRLNCADALTVSLPKAARP